MGLNIYNNTCNLCYASSVNVFALCIQNNLHLFQKLTKLQLILSKSNPFSNILICDSCLVHLRHVMKYEGIMQDFHQLKQVVEHSADINCQCDNCKAKFGNLPLLTEAIEKIEATNNKHVVQMETETKNEQINCSNNSDIIPTTITSELTSSTSPSTSTSRESTKKTMSCEHCKKVFTHKGDLNKHLRKHTGEQPFNCPICDRKFAHTSNLARHIRVHSGDKPFKCERCQRNFSRKDKLVMHQKTKLCLNSSTASS